MHAERKVFEPAHVHAVAFRNRLLRSSVGGRTCNFDGTVTDVWKNFEKRFADGGVGGIVSTTFHVKAERLSPAHYPSIASDRHMRHLRRMLPSIRAGGCRYIVQIGDPGYVTYSSLFPQAVDELSASGGFDFGFGYRNTRRAMSVPEIEASIADHAAAAGRAREAGADGVEVTAAKGYLIQQFLNPAINRRSDDWGGSEDARFRFLDEVMKAVRREVGPDFLVGVRLAAGDFNASPWTLALGRWPPTWASRRLRRGNDVDQMVRYAKRLRGVDYLHVIAGFGFPNPRDPAGRFPFEEVRMFFDSVRHLSQKAALRSAVTHLVPRSFGQWLFNLGWDRPASNLDAAARFKRELPDMTVIANGGFEDLRSIERAVERCDMVSMARALIATPNLITDYLQNGRDVPVEQRCTRCNRCVGRSPTSPLGCYDVTRFGGSLKKMEAQILEWNRPDPA